MFSSLKLFRKRRRQARVARGAAGARAYAIGDIHGRLDLLEAMLERIAEEEEARPRVPAYIVFLGDLIDRGPDSRGVVERLIAFAGGPFETRFLMGNHEEMMLRVLGSEPWLAHEWLSHGGYECAQSYGVAVGHLAAMTAEEVAETLRKHIPEEDVVFLQQFADSFRFGDYLFFHAGIRPGVTIERQTTQDLRWIREGFLGVERDDDFVVVHGHTISEAPDEDFGRIGIDTGAYMGGPLTGLLIENDFKAFLAVGGHRERAKTS
jgi:serine/threonine protein phosphatase 1